MNPAQLSTTVVEALTALVDDGRLTLPDGVPTEVTVERPRQKGHGDYATNVALQLGKKALVDGAATNPRALGELLAARLRESDGHQRRRGGRTRVPERDRRGRCPG